MEVKPPSYCQRLKVKTVDIVAGKLIAILNEGMAKDLGIASFERAELMNPKNGKSIHVVIDYTDSLAEKFEIAVFRDVRKALDTKDGEILEVCAVGKPKSVEFIKKKMDGKKLSNSEILEIVRDIASNRLSEIETSAFVSGVYIRGMDIDETVAMTKALIGDGEKIDFGKKIVVDKHSVGGTNGRATMIIVPIIAAAGYAMPKTSSRSITSASGTADAMEVLADVSLSIEQIKNAVRKTNACIAWGGAVELAPADDKIIKIEHPLSLDPEGQVIASVMAKKASVGAKYVVIDLPIGQYVKVKNREDGERMALKFIEVGHQLGMKIEVVLTNGEEPSGRAFGPALEARYAMEILERKFFDNLAQKSVELAGALLELIGDSPKGQGFNKALNILESGKALEKMKEIITAQNGKILSSEQIGYAQFKRDVLSMHSGEISVIKVGMLNTVGRMAGAPADKKAGLYLHVEEGSKISKGTPLFTIYSENKIKLEAAYKFAVNSQIIEMEKIILQKFS